MADISVPEAAGQAIFTVSLSAKWGQAVSVRYTTTDGSAGSPADYTPASGTLVFAADQTSQTVAVPIVPDAIDEPNETFSLVLSGPTNAIIGDGSGVATIVDDDEPSLSATPTATPTAPPTAAPMPTPAPPAATTKVVDDKSAGFSKDKRGWQSQREGYKGRSFWTTVQKRTAMHVATWTATLDAAGRYAVTVQFPKRNATTRSATYAITTASGTVTRTIDQSRSGGKWVDLGSYAFGTKAVVRLTDKTGERTASGRHIVYDVVRFVPVGQG